MFYNNKLVTPYWHDSLIISAGKAHAERKEQPMEPDVRDVFVWTISENDGSVCCGVDGRDLPVEVERESN